MLGSEASAVRIGITMGDPSGIGPEIVRAALAAAAPGTVVFGDRGALGTEALPAGVALEEVTALVTADRVPGQPPSTQVRM